MNVVYLKGHGKPPRESSGAVKVTASIVGGLFTIVLSPVIAIVCFANQFRCEHTWIPSGDKNSCVKCNKREQRKELLGLEKL